MQNSEDSKFGVQGARRSETGAYGLVCEDFATTAQRSNQLEVRIPNGLYQTWLHERGLAETPVVEAAGVFLRDISPDRTSLIVAVISEEGSIHELELLKRLGSALHTGVSVIAVANADLVPWHWLLSFHSSLNQLILLGPDLLSACQRAGATFPQNALITGDSPAVLNQDVSAKRMLWQKIQNHSRH